MVNKKCAFCELLISKIKAKEAPYDNMTTDTLAANKANVLETINKPIGYCRGFNLCAKHISTIKRDNKYRLSVVNEEIPDSLETKRIQAGDF